MLYVTVGGGGGHKKEVENQTTDLKGLFCFLHVQKNVDNLLKISWEINFYKINLFNNGINMSEFNFVSCFTLLNVYSSIFNSSFMKIKNR